MTQQIKDVHVEPAGEEKAGPLYYQLPASPWENWVKSQNIPIFEDVGCYDCKQLPRGRWDWMGGDATFIQTSGTQNRTGMFVLEVPARGATNPIRHMYEERYVVLEGRGSTEVWTESAKTPQSFEWQQWSCFAIPLNCSFRLVNASSTPAVLIAVNMAPVIINQFQDLDFVFNNSYEFKSRYSPDAEYFKPKEQLSTQIEGRALLRSNLIPDVANAYLPLDNNRGPGYRWFAPSQAGNTMLEGFVAQYPTGRYSKAHYHESGAVLVCLAGKGYSYTWPKDLGPRPWEGGFSDQVKRQDYGPGGMISAAPAGGNWFHQHFAISNSPFRVFNYTGGVRGIRAGGREGERIAGIGAEIGQGGRALGYHEEDPYIREYYQQRLAEEGAKFDMPEEVYKGATNLKVGYD